MKPAASPYIAMEYLEGQTLKHRIATKSVKLDELLDIAIQIADALETANGSTTWSTPTEPFGEAAWTVLIDCNWPIPRWRFICPGGRPMVGRSLSWHDNLASPGRFIWCHPKAVRCNSPYQLSATKWIRVGHRRKLLLFDVKSQTWTELMQLSTGAIGYPQWSYNEEYIYFLGANRSVLWDHVYRVRISDHKVEEVVDLKDFRKAPGPGNWMGLDPDDSPMLVRDAGMQDIHALTLQLP
jgi:hypothetical protein